MTDTNYTEIAMVVDRSGSMTPIAKASEEGIQAFVANQKKEPGVCNFTLVEFDTAPQYSHEVHAPFHRGANTFVGHAPVIKTVYSGPIGKFLNYRLVPRGGTPLLDAIGKTVKELGMKLALMPEERRPGTVIVVVQTDGDENSSREYNYETIRALIATQTGIFGWSFIFLGADQDAIAAGAQMGFAAHNSISYASTDHNTHAVYESVSMAATGLRGGTYRGFTEEDRSAAEE